VTRRPSMDPRDLAWWIAVAGFSSMYLPVYWWALFGMVDADGRRAGIWQSEEQAYGLLLLLVMVWLFWSLRRRINAAPTRPAPGWGWLLFVVGLLLYVVGRVEGSLLFMLGSQPFVVAGVLLLLRGPEAIRIAWFPLFYFIFMIPLPGSFVDAITAPMKKWISVIAVELLGRLGYPISSNGVMLTIGQYPMLVADACPGLHSMYRLLALGTLFMYVMARRSKLPSAVMFGSVLPIAFGAHLVRVIALLLITYHLGDEAGQGFLHSFVAWL